MSGFFLSLNTINFIAFETASAVVWRWIKCLHSRSDNVAHLKMTDCETVQVHRAPLSGSVVFTLEQSWEMQRRDCEK